MTTRIPPPTGAAFGALSAVVGLVLGHLVALATTPTTSPLFAVSSATVDLTPTPVKEWAIATLGTWDKPVLLGSVAAVVLLVSAAAGVVARRSFVAGATLLVALAIVAGAAAVARPATGPLAVLPAVVSAVVAVTALRALIAAAAPEPSPEPSPGGARADAPDAAGPQLGPGQPRRQVLLLAGGLAIAAAAGGALARWLGTLRSDPADVALPAPAASAPPLPTGLESRYADIAPFRTPNEDFYRVDTRFTLPRIDLDGWTLTIDGDVDRVVTLTFDDLLAMRLVERDITLTCVSNPVGGPYVGGARWLGVLLQEVLDLAGVRRGPDQLLSTDVDGMTISTPLDLATDGRDSMVAVGMNGVALPLEHGFPARLVVPGLYGFIGATKWLARITLTTYAERSAYWTQRGWKTDAPIKVASRIDTPRPLSTPPPGEVVVGGVAWAQQRGGVAKVQLRVDDGAWQEARLGPDGGEDYWRQWYLPWDASPGRHRLTVRAVTGDGEVQSAERVDPYPGGASGLQEIVVTVSDG